MTAYYLLSNITPKPEKHRTRPNNSTYCPRYYIRPHQSKSHRIATKTSASRHYTHQPFVPLDLPPLPPFSPHWITLYPRFFLAPPKLFTWCISQLTNDSNISTPDAPPDKPKFSQLCSNLP